MTASDRPVQDPSDGPCPCWVEVCLHDTPAHCCFRDGYDDDTGAIVCGHEMAGRELSARVQR